MSIAKEAALDLREFFVIRGTLSDERLDGVLVDFGIELVLVDNSYRFREVLNGSLLILNRHTTRPWRRWLKGHALGHFLLHRGNQLEYQNTWLIAKQENQAEEFCGWFFLADCWRAMPVWELAEYATLPEPRIRMWLQRFTSSRIVR